ncbi:MAG: sulfite exporter TauE/SafE family protein [Rhodospirillales bacterium]|nr:sulfite exporter TauE/SafE family protein [Rhodospirillales bacterium]
MNDPTTLVLIAMALFCAGVLSGLVAGLLGTGGGIVLVPAYYFAQGFLDIDVAGRMHLAVGTSLAVIVVTAATSARTHWRIGAVNFSILQSYGPGILAGVAMGTALASVVSGTALAAVFASIAILVAGNLAAGEPRVTLGDTMPGPIGSFAFGSGTGAVSTMAGIGGGAVTVAILTVFSTPIHMAVGTASFVGLLVAIPGALGFVGIGWQTAGLPPFSVGYVNLAGFVVCALPAMVMAPIGARLAHRLPRRHLTRIFALFLGAAALRMFWDIFA